VIRKHAELGSAVVVGSESAAVELLGTLPAEVITVDLPRPDAPHLGFKEVVQ
jgi:hypothetical protein